MAKPKQLGLFDLDPATPSKPPEGEALGLAIPTNEPELAVVVTPAKVSRARMREERQQFEALRMWLLQELQAGFSKPLTIKPIHGRTRFVQLKTENRIPVLRIHRRFVDAPESVREALVNWLRGPRRSAPKLVQQFIHELSTLAAAERRLQPVKDDAAMDGQVHKLSELYRKVNDEYFDGTCRVTIGWGKKPVKPARSRHLGSYSAAHHRISIHPMLDSREVPQWVIEFVLFHEMLHSRQPPGTRRPHDAAFREIERRHPDYRRVKMWEREFLTARIRC